MGHRERKGQAASFIFPHYLLPITYYPSSLHMTQVSRRALHTPVCVEGTEWFVGVEHM